MQYRNIQSTKRLNMKFLEYLHGVSSVILWLCFCCIELAIVEETCIRPQPDLLNCAGLSFLWSHAYLYDEVNTSHIRKSVSLLWSILPLQEAAAYTRALCMYSQLSHRSSSPLLLFYLTPLISHSPSSKLRICWIRLFIGPAISRKFIFSSALSNSSTHSINP